MTGPQLPTVWQAPTLRHPDAVYGPATPARRTAPAGIAPARRQVVDPYGRRRAMPAGLLVDLYG